MLHETENNEVSEQHLKDNGKKFSRHCVFVLTLMYKGLRVTARQLERDYNIDGRRLRDIYANRKECKKAWRLSPDGKTQEMEYWLEIPKQTTKSDLQEWWNKHQQEQPIRYKKGEKTAAEHATALINQYKQLTLGL